VRTIEQLSQQHTTIIGHDGRRHSAGILRKEPTVSKDLNKVMIIGRLGADPELRYTPQGTAVTTFRVASGRQWKDADGTTHEDVEWFRVVCWNKLAEVCNTYLPMGCRVYVEGRCRRANGRTRKAARIATSPR
jgi:single stranded DNA-binding protein